MTMAGGLWRDASFRQFWAARVVSTFGSALTTVALPILIYRSTGSAFQTALLSALGVVPYLLFGLLAGALADRTDRRRLMVGCDLLNAALLGSVPLAAALGHLMLPHVYLTALLSASLFVWFDAASFGALPALVGRDRIVRATSLVWSAETIVATAGPAVAGLLITWAGPTAALGVDAVSYLLSGLTLALTRRAFQAGRAPSPGARVPQLLADIREGLAFLWAHPLIRPLSLLGFVLSFTGGGVLSLLVVYAVRGLGLAPTDARLGGLYAAGAVGSLLSSLTLPLLKAVSPARISLIGYTAYPLALLGVALAPSWPLALAALLLWEVIYTGVIINGISLRQRVTPDALQSRVNAAGRMLSWGGFPFGALVAGAMTERLGIRAALLAEVGVALLALGLAWASSLKSYSGKLNEPLKT